MHAKHPLKDWVLLIALVVLWGSSFALNKIALTAIPPVSLVAYRLGLAALLLVAVAACLRQSLRLPWRQWWFFLLLALIGNCIPFFLISWGQLAIDSALAGILMAIMPLMTLLLSHFFLRDEALSAGDGIGFALGFAGIVLLVGPDALSRLGGDTLVAQLAVLAGAVCYAVNAVLARFNRENRPIVTSAGVMLAATFVMVPAALWHDPVTGLEIGLGPALAATALGMLGTALATLIFFKLIDSAGPAFLSLNNYLIPVWAVMIGAVFLDERLDWNAYAALALILLGIGLSQFQTHRHKPETSQPDERPR